MYCIIYNVTYSATKMMPYEKKYETKVQENNDWMQNVIWYIEV